MQNTMDDIAIDIYKLYQATFCELSLTSGGSLLYALFNQTGVTKLVTQPFVINAT